MINGTEGIDLPKVLLDLSGQFIATIFGAFLGYLFALRQDDKGKQNETLTDKINVLSSINDECLQMHGNFVQPHTHQA